MIPSAAQRQRGDSNRPSGNNSRASGRNSPIDHGQAASEMVTSTR
jgi:hypothetical protein